MEAVVYRTYGEAGDVLSLEDVPTPTVRDDEVLVRVAAASINPYDWHFMTGKPYVMRVRFGVRKPAVPDATITESGAGVRRFGARRRHIRWRSLRRAPARQLHPRASGRGGTRG